MQPLRRLMLVGMVVGSAWAGSPGSLQAGLLTFEVDGVITSVSSAGADVAVGDPFSITYTFESTTAARAGSNSTFAVFDALTSFVLNIGSTYMASSAGAPEIQVDNNPGGGFHDRYGVLSRVSDGLIAPNINGQTVSVVAFRLDDSTDAVFSDALILPTSLSLSAFDSDAFFVFLDNGLIEGDVQSISAVPEPTSLALMGVGAFGLLGFVRKRRRTASHPA